MFDIQFLNSIGGPLSVLVGAIWGSFANVIIYRWPKEESLWAPRSHCVKCQKQIAAYDNIPVLSWLILRGRCRHCKAKISTRYPLVELLTAVIFYLIWKANGPHFVTLEYDFLAFGLITISFIDLDHFLIPDILSIPGIFIGLLGAYFNPERSFLDAFLGVLVGGGFLWAVAHVYLLLRKQEGMGGGDIKLLAWIGAVLGWNMIPFVILTASIFGSIIGLLMHRKSKEGLKAVIPFGPYLAFGALLIICGGQHWASVYLHWFIPEL